MQALPGQQQMSTRSILLVCPRTRRSQTAKRCKCSLYVLQKVTNCLLHPVDCLLLMLIFYLLQPLPKNFGKTALGAVHSNYKTIPCKYWKETGKCQYGEGCSFYHENNEKRRLIDPLPNLPEGVTLPPMPEKLKKARYNNQFKNNNYSHNSAGGGASSVEYGGAGGANGSFSQHFSPNQYMSNNFG